MVNIEEQLATLFNLKILHPRKIRDYFFDSDFR